MTQTYNGWTNYETWAVNLWLSNDEGIYSTIQDQARVMEDDELAAYIEELVEELKFDAGISGMFSDLLNHALSYVNWDEIAEFLKED